MIKESTMTLEAQMLVPDQTVAITVNAMNEIDVILEMTLRVLTPLGKTADSIFPPSK